MPIYEYRCRNGHEFEVFQSMAEEPVQRCSECGAPVERVFHPVAVRFKGSGFYTTDYAKAGAKSKASADGAGADSDKRDAKTGESSKAGGSKDSSGDKAKTASGD